jgi:hypothetical protein
MAEKYKKKIVLTVKQISSSLKNLRTEIWQQKQPTITGSGYKQHTS